MITITLAQLIFTYIIGLGMGYAVGQADRPDRAEIKACAIEEIKTNHVTAEEAILRCR